MKKHMLTLVFGICTLFLFGQTQIKTDVKTGDVFKIGTPESTAYQHIDFPRPNIIIKRGGIANYKSVQGYKVVVTDVKTDKEGTIIIKIKPVDGKRFFGSHRVIEADYKAALESGELQVN